MKNMNTVKAQLLKEMFPVGCAVVCDHMQDEHGVPSGTKGKVVYIDDIGNIHVKWENCSSLALIYGVDKFHKA